MKPVLIVTDPDNYLINAGDPEVLEGELIIQYARKGYTIRTITIEEYKATVWKWIWDKQNQNALT